MQLFYGESLRDGYFVQLVKVLQGSTCSMATAVNYTPTQAVVFHLAPKNNIIFTSRRL